MRIGFDGKRTTQNLTGLGNYSRYVIRLLAEFHPQHAYLIYALKDPSPDLVVRGTEYHYPRQKALKSYWRSYGITKDLKKDRIDLFHGLSNEIPYRLRRSHIRSVVTIHDLIFMRYPQYYSFVDRIIYKLKFRHAAWKADQVIAISQQTKRDVVNYFGLKEDRIKVIYQNCDPSFHQIVSEEEKTALARKYSLPKNYLLNVGTIEERKNLMLIVKALKEAGNIDLVVVGRETRYARKVREYIRINDLTERVHFLHHVAYGDLPGIYQQAEIFIYPSRFEGFGIPIVEALHSGIPVIAAKGSCLEEAGGPGSIYVDPDDEAELARHIQSLLATKTKMESMVKAGKEYVKNFADEKIANEIMQVYQNIITNA